MPDRRSDAPETIVKAGSFSYDLAIQPDHDCVIEYSDRAVRCDGASDGFSLINSAIAELREIRYVGRPGLEFDFSAIRKARVANCFGLASLATSCIVRLLGDRMKCLVVFGKRKRDLEIDLHAWSVTLLNGRLAVFDTQFHSSRLMAHSDYWKETAPAAAFNASGVWVGAHSVYEQLSPEVIHGL